MGVLSNYNESVTVVNRTLGAGKYERDLPVRYDGEDILLKPGENHNFPKVAVPFAIKQNILMGSKNPIDPRQYISLIGVVGSKVHPCTPIPEEVLADAASELEVIDRTGKHWGESLPGKATLMRKKGFSSFEAQIEGGTMMDIGNGVIE